MLAIFLLVASSTLPTHAQNDHLCAKVKSGRYSEISLLSFTYDGPDRFLLYEAPRRKYEITQLSERIKPDSFDLTGISYSEWNTGSYEPVIARIPPNEEVQGVYQFWVQKPNIFREDKHGFYVITDQMEHMYDINKRDSPYHYWSIPRNGTFSFAMEQKPEGWVHGFILNQDVFSNTGFYVIHNLWVDWDSMPNGPIHNTPRQTMTPEEKKNINFYFIEQTSSPKEAILVPRSTIPNASRQLFSTLPLGFIFDNHIHLFDTETSCVHILTAPPNLNLDAQNPDKNIKLFRLNVGYEFYFKCDPEYQQIWKMDPKRCDAERKEIPHQSDESTTSNGIDTWTTLKESASLVWTIVTVISVLLIGATGCLIVWTRCNKKPSRSRSNQAKSMIKSQSSNSRANQSSKTVITALTSTGAPSGHLVGKKLPYNALKTLVLRSDGTIGKISLKSKYKQSHKKPFSFLSPKNKGANVKNRISSKAKRTPK